MKHRLLLASCRVAQVATRSAEAHLQRSRFLQGPPCGIHSGVRRNCTSSAAAAAPKLDASAAASSRKHISPAFAPGLYEVPPPVTVPPHIQRPAYADHPEGRPRPLHPEEFGTVQTPGMIKRMRAACQLAAEALAVACEAAKEGVTTDEVDRIRSGSTLS
eukprot:TRINITY_DN10299_c1_g2_i4.p1 TRINITY_DN10299_c1_g2~~TRINITY_DN10299_c1_g2_i4.p1  ORF type:complete len:160 (+),score=29.39 TRINITY_DN10299_c1_g2_i4:71-550(+)